MKLVKLVLATAMIAASIYLKAVRKDTQEATYCLVLAVALLQ